MAFSTPNAQTVIVTALTLTGVTVVVADLHESTTPDVPRLLLGLVLAGIALTFLAMPFPELAQMLAVLILLGALLERGPDAVGAANILIQPKGTVTA